MQVKNFRVDYQLDLLQLQRKLQPDSDVCNKAAMRSTRQELIRFKGTDVNFGRVDGHSHLNCIEKGTFIMNQILNQYYVPHFAKVRQIQQKQAPFSRLSFFFLYLFHFLIPNLFPTVSKFINIFRFSFASISSFTRILNIDYMIHPSLTNFYVADKKMVVRQSQLYKLAQFDANHILLCVPEANCLLVMDKTLDKKTISTHYLSSQPSALDLVGLGGQKFVIVGYRNGTITVSAVDQAKTEQNKNDVNKFGFSHRWELVPQGSQQIFINDIAHSPTNPNIIVNCYNNGSIGVWGLLSEKRLHMFKQVHDKYTYKIRFQTPATILTCGHDCSVVRTDLQKQKYLSLFSHPAPVWCAYPIDQNQLASVGLFGRVMVWDVRSNRIVQVCNTIGHESSYVTAKPWNPYHLFFGDMSLLAKWDRRVGKQQLFSHHQMDRSAQTILFSEDNVYACGRGKDLCRLQLTNQIALTQSLQSCQTFEVVGLNRNKVGGFNVSDLQSEGDSEYEDINSSEEEEEEVEMIQKKPSIKNKQQKKQQPTIEAIAKLPFQLHQKYMKKQLDMQFKPEFDQDSDQEQGQGDEQQIQIEVSKVKELKQKKRQENQKLTLEKQINQQRKPQEESAKEKDGKQAGDV